MRPVRQSQGLWRLGTYVMRKLAIASLLSIGATAYSFTITVHQIGVWVQGQSAFGYFAGYPWESNSAGASDSTAPYIAMTETSHWRTDIYQYGGYSWGEVQANLNSNNTNLMVYHISRLWVKAQDHVSVDLRGHGTAKHHLTSDFSVDDWVKVQFSTQHFFEVLWTGRGAVSWGKRVLINGLLVDSQFAGVFGGYVSNGTKIYLQPGTYNIKHESTLSSLGAYTGNVAFPGYEIQVHETLNKRLNTSLAPSWYSVSQATLEPVGNLSYTVNAGQYFGGNTQSLAASDDDRLYILCDENEPNATLSVNSNYTQPNTGLKVQFETSSSRTDLVAFFEIMGGYSQTPAWETLASAVTSLSDQARQFNWDVLPGPFNLPPASYNYVRPSDGLVQCRIRWIPTQDLEAADGWLVSVDEANMYRPQ